MGFSSASNAILAKSRAMYGKRLTGANYQDLLNCRSVGEVANYLRTRTAYSEVLQGTGSLSVHRGWLELTMQKMLFMRFASLCRFEYSIGESFYRYFILRSDIAQVLRCIRLLNDPDEREYLFLLPDFFLKHTNLDLEDLTKVTSFGELLTVLKNTPYLDIIKSFEPKDGGQIDFTSVEVRLSRYLFDELYAMIDRGYGGRARAELKDILGTQADMQNIVIIYRLKRFFGAGEDYIREVLLPHGSRFSKRQLDALIRAKNGDDMLRRLAKTSYGQRLEKVKFDYIEKSTDEIRYMGSLKKIRFSPRPPVVMLSYVNLLENEVSNVTHIIEGIRYNIPPDEIKTLLIGVGD